jgi:4-hydroxy-tetrahydrodipicolinate reductase
MNIALIGYGKMGKEIERIAKLRGHQIGLVIDVENQQDLNPEKLADTDVAIEFSTPQSAYNNIITCLKSNIAVVSGTTGWLDRWDDAVKLANETKVGLFYASNYSIGVNILFAVNEHLAGIMAKFSQYDVSIEEIHHIHKKDAPSGTAITLANQIAGKLSFKTSWSLRNDEAEKIFINTCREGEIHGFHKVIYDSEIDTIELSHNAKSRVGFATGAVLAAEYMIGKNGVHSMKDLLNL